MSVYFIAQIQVEDKAAYQKYVDSADKIFQNYNGTYLAVDDSPMCLEGIWDESRIVVIEFPDKDKFKAWYCSAEYQEILKYRLKAAQCDSILIKGMN
ncbi:MAG: DUF1330 domain-containing protein [Bacteroidota bacterium]